MSHLFPSYRRGHRSNPNSRPARRAASRGHRDGRIESRLRIESLEDRSLLTVTLVDSPDVNASQLLGNQDESAIAINPLNPQQMFVSSNHNNGLFAAFSNDGGVTWLSSAGSGDTAPGDFSIANANDTLPDACCDPTASWDQFGNLFLGYLDSSAPRESHLAISTNGGQTFTFLASLGTSTDQPTVTTGPGLGGANGSVWVTYDEAGPGRVARGAAVTGLGAVGAFGAAQNTGVGQFGDITIGPTGQVVVTGQSDTAVQVATDPDGLGAAPFNATVVATATNVARFDSITAQPNRTIDAEAGLAYDLSGGPFNGRLYLVYTDEQPNESNDTDILLRTSTNNGANWSAPIQVNDDVGTTSQFFSKIAVDQTTGNIGIAWFDARNDPATNRLVEIFATVSDDGGATFSPNLQVGDGQTNGTVAATGGQQLGDYIGLAFDSGVLLPSWCDNSNSTGDNPNGTLQQIDVYISRVTASAAPVITNLAVNPTVVDEGGSVTLTATYQSAQTHDVLIDWGDGTITSFVGVAPGVHGLAEAHTYEDDHPLTGTPSDILDITLTITDVALQSDQATVQVTVNNVDPVIVDFVSDAPAGDPAAGGDPVNILANFTDVGVLDTHSAVVDWGDGTVEPATVNQGAGVGTVTGSHVYATGGIFDVTLTLTDDDTGADQATTTAWVSGVGLTPAGILEIIGTNDDDRVTISKFGNTLRVFADFLASGSFVSFNAADVTKALAYLFDGNDHFIINSNVTFPAIAHGGAGNDLLKAGGGPSVLLGEEGDDNVVGGDARDILIGGVGADLLMGGVGEDLLIGGSTTYDLNDMALMDLLTEWTANESYDVRVARLRNGTGPTGIQLAAGVTVLDDHEADRLVGSFGLDWFFIDPLDTAPDRKSNELVN